jgi:negative regulator of sigma-B (phosphoserine phosphatase)
LSEGPGAQSLLEVGAASAALHGESVSGDEYAVVPFTGGVLIGAVDGLGHGDEAAHAATRAVSVLEEDAAAPVTTLFQRCHARLARTRGVVMSLASFYEGEERMTWLGVGNVEGTLLRADAEAFWPMESILLLGGVVGFSLPRLRASTTELKRGDTIILTTDGIESGFRHGLRPGRPAQDLAEQILADHRKHSDDALVLVARYLGGEE